MDEERLKKKIFKVTRAADKDTNQEPQYVQVLKKKFEHVERNFMMLQIIDVSENVLYDRNRSQNDFLQMINSCVQHDLRQPLNSISDTALLNNSILENLESLAQFKDQDTDQQRKLKKELVGYVKNLNESLASQDISVKLLKFLFNDWTDYGEIKVKKFKKNMSTFCIKRVVDQVMMLQKDIATKKGIRFQSNFYGFDGPKDNMIFLDRQRLI